MSQSELSSTPSARKVEEWEERFNNQFEPSYTNNDQEECTLFLNTSPQEIKSFIHSLLLKQREEIVETLERIKEDEWNQNVEAQDALTHAITKIKEMI